MHDVTITFGWQDSTSDAGKNKHKSNCGQMSFNQLNIIFVYETIELLSFIADYANSFWSLPR